MSRRAHFRPSPRSALACTLPPHRFVKHYRAHLSPILSLAVSADGRLAATVAADGQMLAAGGYKDNVKGSVKVFDIENFGACPRSPVIGLLARPPG